MRKLVLLIIALLIVLAGLSAAQRYIPQLRKTASESSFFAGGGNTQNVKVVSEESVVINVVKKVSPSVVTIAATSLISQNSTNDPFSFFGFSVPPQQQQTEPNPTEPQNIGSGFIITKDGIIVTNKHVVADTSSKYQVITSANKKYDVEKIYRDPTNDIAILKITPGSGDSLPPVDLGDSGKLQVGQLAVAIGTPLGEFNGSVTSGIISGLGRGITAGSPFEGFVEQLDNVIQTDAAISPGNSGGPLINSSGQVIGVNTAVSQSGQNIGFAMPINTVKESIKNFNDNGQFNRPFLGVSYRMLTKDMAIRYDLAVGAYVESVVPSSSADKAGVERGDVITQFDGQKVVADSGELSKFIARKKVGDTVKLTLYRDGKTVEVSAVLDAAPSQ